MTRYEISLKCANEILEQHHVLYMLNYRTEQASNLNNRQRNVYYRCKFL